MSDDPAIRMLQEMRRQADEHAEMCDEMADAIEEYLDAVPDKYAEHYWGKAAAWDEVGETIEEALRLLKKHGNE